MFVTDKQDRVSSQGEAAVIYLAGGCFWGTEKLMRSIAGVVDAESGYANGAIERPTYEQVCSGTTGFRETVHVTYDPARVSLETILFAYFRSIDPSAVNRQGNDRGTQYQAGIYYIDARSRAIIDKVAAIEKERCAAFNVEIAELRNFYSAETYHQDYLDKNPGGYCHVSPALMRQVSQMSVDASTYVRSDDAELHARLSPLQYEVARNAATEPPFTGEHTDRTDQGLYVDVVTGEPLFLSSDKFACSCGWPAFRAPIDPNVLVERVDRSHGMIRTEVRSRVGNSHLGHVFTNDSESPNGLRYCIDSAALRFIPVERMEAQGYGAFTAQLG